MPRRSFPVIDGHVDLLHHLRAHARGALFENVRRGVLTPGALAAGGVRVVVSALYCPDEHNGPDTARGFLRRLYDYDASYVGSLPLASTRGQLEQVFEKRAGAAKLLLLENADALADMDVEGVAQLGLCAASLTHVGENRLAQGNMAAAPTGLTRAGARVARLLSGLDIALDAAHLAEPCFHQAADMGAGRIISSHTGVRAVHDSPRNLDDAQIRIIAERGGVVGLAADPNMLNGSDRAGVHDFLAHLDHVAGLVGPRHAALGSDFGGFAGTTTGLEDPSRFPSLEDLLLERGYSQRDVAGIMGRNWYEFYLDALPGD